MWHLPKSALMCMLSCFIRVRLFVTPWTVANQAPLSMGFSRQEYWSGLPFPSPGNLSDSGIEPASPEAPSLREINNLIWGFSGGTSGKEPACQSRRHERHGFDHWVGKIPWRRAWQSTPVFLAGYSPSLQGHKESDTTEAIYHTCKQ